MNTVAEIPETQEARRQKWQQQLKQERAGHQATIVRQQAQSFLLDMEAAGFQAYAIVGIPNKLLRGSALHAHLQSCNECDGAAGDWCDDGHEALFDDQYHDHVFVFKTREMGDSEDYCGLAYELSDDGRACVDDLLGDAETVSAEPMTIPAGTNSGTGLVYTAEFWQRANALVAAPQRCEQCKRHLSLKTKPVVNVRVVMLGDGTPSPDRLHLLCTRCYPDPVEEERIAA
jgi:hypothetical protein